MKLLEKIYLGIMFFLFLWVSVGAVFDHQISHDFPWGYGASDAFQHQSRTRDIQTLGNYQYEASWSSAGYDDTAGFYPPILYHSGIFFGNVGGLESWDSTYFLTFFLVVLSLFVMYLIIRHFNTALAVLSLPFMFLVFYKSGLVAFFFGSWPSLLSHTFVVCLFWALLKIDKPWMWIVFGLLASFATLSHTSEFIFAAMGLILYFLWNLWKFSQTKEEHFKKRMYALMLSVLPFFLLTSWYLIIFKFTWMHAQPFTFGQYPEWGSNAGIYLADFGILLFVVIAGALLGMSVKKIRPLVLLGVLMFALGFLNYAGFSFRAFQLRLFWPVYWSVLFGVVFYLLLRKRGALVIYGTGLVLALLLSGTIPLDFIPHVESGPVQGTMNPYHWEAFEWIRTNTPQDAEILMLYGDLYWNLAIGRNMQRTYSSVTREGYVRVVQTGEPSRIIQIERNGDSGGVKYAYRTSLFDWGYHLEEDRAILNAEKDVCTFPYVIMDALPDVSGQPPLAAYNLAMRERMLANGLEEVFNNQVVSILHNPTVGEACV